MKRFHPRAGLTLIEVLVAISLLSLLSVGLLMALRVGVTAWERAHADLMLDRRIANANSIFHAELEAIVPALVQFQNPVIRSLSTTTFFQGQPDAMRFVTAYSLEGGPRSGLRLVELQVVSGDRGRRVLLNEQPYEGPRAAGGLVTGASQDPGGRGLRLSFAPIQARPSSFVIADELGGCAFSYLTQAQMGRSAQWKPVWDNAYELPAGISIDLVPRPGPEGLPVRLQPVRVTVPIRSTMSPQPQ